MNQYTESVLGAIDLIVQERMKDLKFDKTVVCTIVENKGEGLYLVDDGATIFEAVSDLMSYPVGFQVNVLIPQGDYKNQKTITGRYIANTGELDKVRYMTPFDNCLDASGNIMAEGNYKIEEKDYSNVYSLLTNDESRTEIPIWEYSFPEDMMNGCPYLGLAADFLTGLSDYMPISGSYGFHLVIEGEAKENMEINKDYYFDSSDMYGNPYLFETYFRQEKVFDISNYKKLKSITLSFYQNNDFNYNLEGETKKIPFEYTDITGKHKMPDNIMAKNLYLFLGYNLSDFEKDTILLFTTSDSTYDFEIPETGKKDMKITWIRKDGSTTYIQEEEDLTPSIRIHWYIKDKTSKADPIAGDGWKEISNGFSNFTYIDYQLPNLKTEETRIKVIITEGSFDETHSVIEEAARINNKYESNILIFTSSKDVPDETTIDVLTGLELKIINDTYQGNYRIYGEDKKLKNTTEGVRVRSIIPVLKLGDKEIELTKEDQVIWEVPTIVTMINLVTSASNINENTNAEIKQEGNVAKLDYKIRKTYLETYINNTVKCTVIRKGTEYSKDLTMYFGPTGTAGTEYTFVIEPEDGFEAYTVNSKKPIKLFAKLYDYNDEPVEWVNQTIKWDWATEDETEHAFDGVTGNTGAYITLIPKDGLEVENFDLNNYLYNLIKATVSTDVVYKTSVPKMDEKGNYLDANDNILEVDSNGDIIDSNKIVWTDGTTEPRTVTMIAYYGVPIRTNEKYFMTGATSVYYNDNGAKPIYEKVDYKLYGIDENIDSKWEVVFSNKNEKNKGIENFIPQIVKTKTNGYQLKPKPMFIQDLPKEISIICYETNKTNNYFWMQPLIISQNKYASSLLNQWDGSLTINEKDGIILSTMVGAGIKNKDNTFSGVLMGDVEKGSGNDAISELGLYGYHHGVQSFGFKIDGTAFLGKAGTGRIEFDGNKGIIESAGFNSGLEEGMSINLKDGSIEAYDFLLKATGIDEFQTITEIVGYEEKEIPVYDENGEETEETEIVKVPIYETKEIRKIETKLRLSNMSPYFQIIKINYDNQGNKNRELDLIHVANNDYYLQSENFNKTNINGSITANGLKISLKEGQPAITTNGFKLEATPESGKKNKMLINSSATSYPFEIGYLSGNSIINGIRIGWGGVTQWGNYNDPGVTIQGSGITIGDKSLDSYIRDIVEGYGYITSAALSNYASKSHTHTYSLYSKNIDNYVNAQTGGPNG